MPAFLTGSAAVMSIVVSSEPLRSSSRTVFESSRTTIVSRTASYSMPSASIEPYLLMSNCTATTSSPVGGTPLKTPLGPGVSPYTSPATPSVIQTMLCTASYATPSGSVSPNVDVLKLVGVPPAAAWTNNDFLSSSV